VNNAELVSAHGPLGLINSTTQLGRNGVAGVSKGKSFFFQAHVNEVVNFLSQCYSESKSYSTVNTYRSALSSTLHPVNNAVCCCWFTAVRGHASQRNLSPQSFTSTLFVNLGCCQGYHLPEDFEDCDTLCIAICSERADCLP